MVGPNSTRRGARVLLVLATLDNAAFGIWAIAIPAGLFDWLGLSPSADALLLWRLMGVVLLLGAGCLLAAARSSRNAGLMWVPLTARILLSGIWLWLLGTQRVAALRGPLGALLVHDGTWLGLVLSSRVLERDRPEKTLKE